MFADAAAAVEAFLSAGATELAVRYSGQSAVATALYDALTPFTGESDQVSLPGWFRVVQADEPADVREVSRLPGRTR